MAGRDERKKILGQLKARQAALSRDALAGTSATVGQPTSWPAEGSDYRPTLAGTFPKSTEPLRITIRETADGLGVHVPSVKQIFAIVFILLWLGGWAAGEWFALYEIYRNGFSISSAFLIFWVTIWTIGGMGAAFGVLWQLFGSERLFITAGAVVSDWGFGPFRFKKVWGPGEATKFRKGEATMRKGRLVSGRGIAYEAGGAMRTFGSSLTDDEVRFVLAAIARHLPGAVLDSAAAKAG
ncbi:MAG: hypothetical protein KF849_10410 [Rhizobiaceae bacterium]|nr:hypothetical protein [Rhizobiaceae bacterium]